MADRIYCKREDKIQFSDKPTQSCLQGYQRRMRLHGMYTDVSLYSLLARRCPRKKKIGHFFLKTKTFDSFSLKHPAGTTENIGRIHVKFEIQNTCTVYI